MKRCSKCNKLKHEDEFSPDKYRKDGLRSWCMICNRICSKEYRKTDKAKTAHKENKLRYNYGITLDDKWQMFADQRGCCAICGKGKHIRKLYIDHNHESGKVRGLLCNRCNTGMGYVDNIELLEKMITYREKHRDANIEA